MPIGIYRVTDGWGGVEDSVYIEDEGGAAMDIPRSRYEIQGYEPPYNELPSKEEYLASSQE